VILAQRRRWMAAGSAALLATGLSGCGIQATGISVVGAAPSSAAPSAAAAPSVASSGQVYIYLLLEQDGTIQLVPVVRTIVGQRITDGAVAQLLVKGPTTEETKEGFSSDVPDSLVVAANALGFSDSYSLSTYLGSWAKTQFICTMQEYDQSQSVGYFYPGTAMTQATWLACKDTTSAYVKMPGFADSNMQAEKATPVPPSTLEPAGK
jgi:hypothetical protein